MYEAAGTDSIAVKHTERIHDRIADAQEVRGLAETEHRRFEAYLDEVLGPSTG